MESHIKINVDRLLALMTHMEDQHLQPYRDYWKSYGFDYDRGDLLIINENVIPEIIVVNTVKNVERSKYLSDDIQAVFVKNVIPDFKLKW